MENSFQLEFMKIVKMNEKIKIIKMEKYLEIIIVLYAQKNIRIESNMLNIFMMLIQMKKVFVLYAQYNLGEIKIIEHIY